MIDISRCSENSSKTKDILEENNIRFLHRVSSKIHNNQQVISK